MKIPDLVANTEFAKHKKEMLDCLQGIDYQTLQNRISPAH